MGPAFTASDLCGLPMGAHQSGALPVANHAVRAQEQRGAGGAARPVLNFYRSVTDHMDECSEMAVTLALYCRPYLQRALVGAWAQPLLRSGASVGGRTWAGGGNAGERHALPYNRHLLNMQVRLVRALARTPSAFPRLPGPPPGWGLAAATTRFEQVTLDA